jgi:hypothetical protein
MYLKYPFRSTNYNLFVEIPPAEVWVPDPQPAKLPPIINNIRIIRIRLMG